MQLDYANKPPISVLQNESGFTDEDADSLWWYEQKSKTTLRHGNYAVGEVSHVITAWQAKPYWYEISQLFDTEEEAKAWLATMYKFR